MNRVLLLLLSILLPTLHLARGADEATAAAEAMTMARRVSKSKSNLFFVDDACFPQTIDVIKTRAGFFGFELVFGAPEEAAQQEVFGAIFQYPNDAGEISDLSDPIAAVKSRGGVVAVASDLMALVLLKSPGEMGADMAFGSSQRFGIPTGFGGPHAAFFATRDEHKRSVAGRIIGVSVDARGNRALRMALQTREQHIRREKANSNICTSQVLLANLAGMYAVYHGPQGLRRMAERLHGLARMLSDGARAIGHGVVHDDFFDTVRINPKKGSLPSILHEGSSRSMNVRAFPDGTLGIALDELTDRREVMRILGTLAGGGTVPGEETLHPATAGYAGPLRRTSPYLTHPVFNRHHSETGMLRYLHGLESKDLALNVSMIPLGSCTMKLTATSEMIPVTWPALGKLHPFAPPEQAAGYHAMFAELSSWLAEITGFPAVSLQPAAGAHGEVTALLVAAAYFRDQKQNRSVVLIPDGAHGTNPASAAIAGYIVESVKSTEAGVLVGDEPMERGAKGVGLGVVE